MKISKFWISIVSIIAALAIITIVLGFIPLKNAPDLVNDSLSGIVVQKDGGAEKQLNKTDSADDFNKITKAYNNTKYFTVLRGILVGRVSGIKLTPDKNDGDRFNEEAIKALKAGSGNNMLVFKYNSVQTMTIKGEVFSFNQAKILVPDSSGEIGEFTIALYDTNQFFVAPDGPGDDRYSIRYIKAQGKCTKLYNAANAIFENK